VQNFQVSVYFLCIFNPVVFVQLFCDQVDQALAVAVSDFDEVREDNKQIDVSGINMYRIEVGRIVAEWEQMDSIGMLQQLGVGGAG